MSTTTWTEERRAAVRVMHNLGKPAQDIADRFGVSKNAILGLLNRMGLSTPRQPPNGGENASPTRRAMPTERVSEIQEPQPVTPSLPPPVLVLGDAIAAPRAPTAGTGCKWPLWPHDSRPTHAYCGKQLAALGVPYCAEHMAVAYQPVPKRERSLNRLADLMTGQWVKGRRGAVS